MAVTIPTAVNDNTTNPNTRERQTVGTVTAGIKTNGNIPISLDAGSTQVGNGDTGGFTFNFDEADGASSSSLTYDVSSETKLLVCSWQYNAPNRLDIDTLANGGIELRLVTGTGDSNYRSFYICGNDTAAGKYQQGANAFVIDMNATADHPSDPSDTGTYDNTDVQCWGWIVKGANVYGSNYFGFHQKLHIFDTDLNGANIVKFTGTSDFDDIIEAVTGTSQATAIGNWVQKIGSTYNIPVAFQIGDASTATNFDDNGVTVITPTNATSDDPRYRYTAQGLRVYVRLRDNAADDCVLSGTYSWGVASPWDMDFDNAASVDITGAKFNGMGKFTVGGSVSGAATFTLNGTSVVEINGADLDGSTINGDCDLVSNAVTTLTGFTITGALDFDTAGTYTLDNCDVDEVTNSSGGAVTVILTNGSTTPTNTGPDITIQQIVTLTVSDAIDDTAIQVYNVTKDAQLDYEAAVSGGSGYSLELDIASAGVDVSDVIRVRGTYQEGTAAKLPVQVTATVTSSDLALTLDQEDWDVYNDYGADGSTMDSGSGGEFSWDGLNLEIDIDDPDNETVGQRVGAWYAYYITTEDGIENMYGMLDWESFNSIKIITAVGNLKLNNADGVNPLIISACRIYADDGSCVLATGTSIQLDYDPVYNISQDALETDVAAIKAKTDDLTFTGNDVHATLDGETVTASSVTDKTGYSISGTLQTLDALDTAIDGAFTEIKGATWSDTTDTLEDIRDAVDTKASQSSVDTVDGNVDSILEDTGITLPATLTTIEGKIDTVDTNVDSVLEDTGTTIPGTLTTIEGKVDTVDTNVDAVLVDTTRVDGLIEDSGGDRFTTKALEQAAAGSGLSAQEVRDAMKLAPTVGAPAAGSVDEALDDIYTDTQRVDGLIEDDSGDQFTEKALSQAPGGGGVTDANLVSVGGTAVTDPADLRAKITLGI